MAIDVPREQVDEDHTYGGDQPGIQFHRALHLPPVEMLDRSIALRGILVGGEQLKIPGNVQTSTIFALQRFDVIDVVLDTCELRDDLTLAV